ncbi:hypothetical protein [Nonomuraea turcica]|uniref:hypothetical protein n=1 Tax=Nonomuraea sp. G32 TaxID=3067274 RepID=UPI00273BD05E|nr:hypothetical protein [Nonomuraea sp. G32]MDP4505510.1 hypothetical protein [Nonomuraea sp. G32]
MRQIPVIALSLFLMVEMTASASAASTLTQVQVSSSADDRASQATSAGTTAMRTCGRRSDWYMSCVCPAGYNVRVFGYATDTPAMMWWGITLSHMRKSRSPISGYGTNPRQYNSTGYKSFITGQQIVYYSTGGGWQADQWSSMGAACTNVF